MKNILKYFKKTYIIGLLLTIALVASAWTGPSENPPGGNVVEPINTSPQAQIKYGGINFTDWTDSTSGQTGYYVDPGGNSLFNRIYSHDIRVTVEPTEDNQVATKAYVDASGGGDSDPLIDVITTTCDATIDLMVGFNRTTRIKMVCDYNDGNGAGWVSMQSTAFTSNFPAGSSHDENDCTANGGEIVAISPSIAICRFEQSSCPSGWDNYDNWRTVIGTFGPSSGTYRDAYPSCSPSAKYNNYNKGCDPTASWNSKVSPYCAYYTCTYSCFWFWPSGRQVCNPKNRYGTTVQIGCY